MKKHDHFLIPNKQTCLEISKIITFLYQRNVPPSQSWPGDKTINLMKSFRSVCIHSLLHFDFKSALIFYSTYWRNDKVFPKSIRKRGSVLKRGGRMLVFVICGFIKKFLTNSYFILHIHQAKGFEMIHYRYLYFNFSARYS